MTGHWPKPILFTKRRADALAKFMSVPAKVDALHGDMRQTLRQKVLRNFRGGELRALIATDVAARGIDAGLSHVINFDLTDTRCICPPSWAHRASGSWRSCHFLCAPNERHKLEPLFRLLGGLTF